MRKIIFLLFLFCFMADSTSSLAAKRDEGWKEHRSTHFRIYYKKAPRDFVETIEEFAERYYKEIVRDLGFVRYKNWTYDERAQIYIYDDKEDYVTNAKLMGWSHGAARARTKEIWTFPAAHGFFDTTLPHELTHIIFREIVGYKSNIPLWLDEGVAMYMEKARRYGAHKEVIKAIEQGDFLTVDDLYWVPLRANSPKALVNLFYAESASLVNYLINEHGEHRFERFCREIAKGQRYEYALSKVYTRFNSVKDLNDVWVGFLKDLANDD